MSDEKWIWKLDRTIRSVPDRCATVIEEVLNALEANAWSDRDCFGIRMAMEEAILNAIRHGNQCDIAKLVVISIRLSAKRFTATISDEGKGFDPADLPDPADDENLERSCGRGVSLIRNYMDTATYNDTGNSLFISKLKSPSANQNGKSIDTPTESNSDNRTVESDQDGG